MRILAIDPGNIESGYADISLPDFKLHSFGKIKNEELLGNLESIAYAENYDTKVIEMIAGMGMAVGQSVFDTCVWIGRFAQVFGGDMEYVFRRDEKTMLCGTMRAKDANIRQALIDRYAKFDFKSGKGTKKNPDTFYGVSKDVWSAIAVGVTYYDMLQESKAAEK